MSAILDQVKDDDVRVFRRYGIRTIDGVEYPQEEVITYRRSKDADHNYTYKLPQEEDWWLIESVVNLFTADISHQGHTPISSVAPHLNTPKDDVKLIIQDEYENLINGINKRIEEEKEISQKILETFVDEKQKAKKDFIAKLKKDKEVSVDSLIEFLEKFV
mgnify:FL=1